MRVNLDSRGNVIAMGAERVREVSRVDQRDHAVSDPHAMAEQIRREKRDEERRVKEAEKAQKAKNKAREKELKAELKRQEEEYKREQESMRHNGECCGEDQMLAIAALQTMGGFARDFNHGISGYGLSSDGSFDHSRGLGFDFSSITNVVNQASSTLQNALAPIQQAVQIIRGPSAAEIEAARAAAEAKARAEALARAQAAGMTLVQPGMPGVAAQPSALSALLSKKVAGVPVVALAGVGVVGIALLALRRR